MTAGLKTRALLAFILLAGCTTQFFPEYEEMQEYLVVDALITDQPGPYTVKISRSTPVGTTLSLKPVKGAAVTISDDLGSVRKLKENASGTYLTDSAEFRGVAGRSYSLSIRINNRIYESDYIAMNPVPTIDSVYYEKVTITSSSDIEDVEEGCNIYLDTYDPTGRCMWFRWDFTETWEYRIPYTVTNRICWITENSNGILLKNTSVYSKAKVTKYPVLFISNKSDRLKVKYSILVSQYSIGEKEYDFWNKVSSVAQNVGNLYDKTPSAVKGNIRCTSNPDETVLGYFSVSAVTRRRLFIEDEFLGLPTFVTYCATDTLYGALPPLGLNSSYWVIEDNSNEVPPWWVITTFRECADCTTEGSKIRPDFWDEDRKTAKK